MNEYYLTKLLKGSYIQEILDKAGISFYPKGDEVDHPLYNEWYILNCNADINLGPYEPEIYSRWCIRFATVGLAPDAIQIWTYNGKIKHTLSVGNPNFEKEILNILLPNIKCGA